MDEQKISRAGGANSAHLVETGICVTLVVMFCVMFFHSYEWEIEAGLFPRLISGFGVVSTLAYLAQLIWRNRMGESKSQRRILDIPWAKVSGDSSEVKRAATGIVVWALAFWLGVVLVGFHVAAPVYLYSQLVLYGKIKPWAAALGAGACLLFIILVYDRLAGTTWNDPVLFDLVKVLFLT